MFDYIVHHKKSVTALFTILVAAGAFYLIYSHKATVKNTFKELETATNELFVQTLNTTISEPPPLKDDVTATRGALSDVGVFVSTNTARAETGLPALTMNTTLNVIAQKKLQDMFFYQYFEHISPTGVGAGDLAKKNGYDYIVIGENLAMGNFKNDQALVDAWMQSPGHRANILNTRYKEIGIAVGEGIYEGKLTWIAVQEFGLPNTCDQPSAIDKKEISTEKTAVDTQEKALNALKAEIDAMPKKSSSEYSAKVAEYNDLVKTYNDMVLSLKAKIALYNKQVADFNTCAQTT